MKSSPNSLQLEKAGTVKTQGNQKEVKNQTNR